MLIISELKRYFRSLMYKFNNRHIKNQDLKIAKIIKKKLNKYVKVIKISSEKGKTTIYFEVEKE